MEKDELRRLVTSTMQRFQRINISSLFDNISQGEFHTLEMIHRQTQQAHEEIGVTVSELAKCQNTSLPAVSRNLRTLEEKGWIERSADPKDRRNTYVYLTKAGMEKEDEVASIFDALTLGVIDRVGEENIQKFTDICILMQEAMQEEVENYLKNK